MKKFQALTFVTGLFVLFSVICQGDTITINLTSSLLSGTPGSALTFSGTLTNTTASTVFLNSAGLNLAGSFDPADEDTSPFFNNAPIFLAGNASTSAIDLFTINIPAPFATGTYPGMFTILGGVDGNAQDTLGSASFTVQVASTVPEPNPGSLLGTAFLIGLILHLSVRKRWYIQKPNS